MALLSRKARVATKAARTGIRTYGKVKHAQGRLGAGPNPAPAGRVRDVAAGIGIGALAALLFDRQQGRRRRHEAGDRGVAALRRGVQEAARKADYAGGVARGAAHAVIPDAGTGEPLDDVTLTRKVESEIFRAPDAPKGKVVVNAEHGVVYLRGEVEQSAQISELVESAARVNGVRRVENMLHQPGTPAPTKR